MPLINWDIIEYVNQLYMSTFISIPEQVIVTQKIFIYTVGKKKNTILIVSVLYSALSTG